MDEPEWNHAGGLDVETADLGRALAAVRDALAAAGRRPAIVLDPFSRPTALEELLRGRGWEEAFRHAGLIFPGERPSEPVDWPPGSEVEELSAGPPAGGPPASPGSIAAFAGVFRRAFEETAGGELSPGYDAAFAAAFERPRGAMKIVHTLVRIDGEPAAVGSRALVDGVAGLYNLGVDPRFRRAGLGGAVTLHRVAAARAAGADVVYLLTEDPRVEAAQRRRGFVKRFELVGLVAPD